MRKSIDRAAVRKVIKEVQFLRGLKGDSAFAYGPDLYGGVLGGQLVLDYRFEIVVLDGHLTLVVDAYTASGRAEAAGDAWDVDQWDAEKIILRVSENSRAGYQELVRIARLLLAGYDVRLEGSDVYLKGIQNAKRCESYTEPTSCAYWAMQHDCDPVNEEAFHA